MKYFTKEWCLGILNEKKINSIANEYNEYIDKIYYKLPVTLKLLAKNVSLHDGIVKSVLFDKKNNILEIYGIFGDLQFGYFNLGLRYFNVDAINISKVHEIFLNKNIEILNDEIEILSEEKFSHRFIFQTKQEFEILFTDIEITVTNASSKEHKMEICLLKV